MSYPVVKSNNFTEFHANGDVVYCSAFCSDDPYCVNAHSHREAQSREAYLVKKKRRSCTLLTV